MTESKAKTERLQDILITAQIEAQKEDDIMTEIDHRLQIDLPQNAIITEDQAIIEIHDTGHNLEKDTAHMTIKNQMKRNQEIMLFAVSIVLQITSTEIHTAQNVLQETSI
jgi:hypothetical protein